MSKSKKIGLSPGTLIYTGEPSTGAGSSLRSVCYDEERLEEMHVLGTRTKDPRYKQWTELYGVQDAQMVQAIGTEYNIHPLALEDVMDITNRVKIDYYDEGVFCILQFMKYTSQDKNLRTEQISIYFSDSFLVSFQQDPDDTFAVLRKRMQQAHSRIRARNVDYLFYAMIDYVVDCYFIIADALDEEVRSIEERVHQSLDEELVTDIYSIRTRLIRFRNFIFPLREEIARIRKVDNQFIHPDTLIYFRDLEDHIIQLMEMSDSQRELLNGLKDLIYSQSSLKLNKDIKWLTVLSTISIPIVLLTGIYGMNFRHMPELEWQYGYLIWWAVTITIIFSLFVYFRRKRLF